MNGLLEQVQTTVRISSSLIDFALRFRNVFLVSSRCISYLITPPPHEFLLWCPYLGNSSSSRTSSLNLYPVKDSLSNMDVIVSLPSPHPLKKRPPSLSKQRKTTPIWKGILQCIRNFSGFIKTLRDRNVEYDGTINMIIWRDDKYDNEGFSRKSIITHFFVGQNPGLVGQRSRTWRHKRMTSTIGYCVLL